MDASSQQFLYYVQHADAEMLYNYCCFVPSYLGGACQAAMPSRSQSISATCVAPRKAAVSHSSRLTTVKFGAFPCVQGKLGM